MHILAWIVSGLVAGWLTGYAVKGRGYGLTGNLLIGLSGGVLGGWVFAAAGVTAGDSLAIHVPIALSGGLLLVASVRALDRSATRAAALAGLPAPSVDGSDLEHQIRRLGEIERQVLMRFIRRAPAAREPRASRQEGRTFGERVADRAAAIGGSWTFLGLFGGVIAAWILLNAERAHPFDPFPFILLNLVLSCLAAIQAPVIMMSQNRQAATDRAAAAHDYEINLKAELEILALHDKLDAARTQELKALVELQRQQLELLQRIEGVIGRQAAREG